MASACCMLLQAVIPPERKSHFMGKKWSEQNDQKWKDKTELLKPQLVSGCTKEDI